MLTRLQDFKDWTLVKIGEQVRFHVVPALLPIVERNLVPDSLVRFGIRRELAMELAKVKSLTTEQQMDKTRKSSGGCATRPSP